jgi:uncharacterized protein
MALPEHVKRQAMDAVDHKETTAQIRLYRDNTADRELFKAPPQQSNVEASREIPDHVKQQAKDAVGNIETTHQIRLVKDSGSPTASSGGSNTSCKAAENLAKSQKSEHNTDRFNDTITKDNFGREHG